MEINITWNICRVCLQEEQKSAKETKTEFRHIFNEDKRLSQHIYDFSGIMMQPNDSLPDKICLKCFKIINNAVNLRKTCRASNVYLQNVLERTRAASSLFKPVAAPAGAASEGEEDDLEEQVETEVVSESEHTKVQQQQPGVIEKLPEIDENMQQLEQAIEGVAANDNALDLVEQVEHSEDIINVILDEDNAVVDSIANLNEECKDFENVKDKMEKSETSQLQKFYMNARFTKFKSTEDEELEDGSEQDLAQVDIEKEEAKANQEDDLYYLVKDIKNEETNNSSDNPEDEQQQTEEQTPLSNETIEYYAIEDEEENMEEDELEEEEDLMLHFETNNDDNLQQVSSTVDTNDEADYNEQNSNASNIMSDLEEEYIVDDNFSNYKQEEEPKSLNVSTTDGENANCITISSSRSKMKRYPSKASAAGGGQQLVCVCEICGNQFTNRNLMNLHMKVHYQEKNHQCELCSKRFITACNLQAHMRIHTGEKPFQCRFCGRRFNDRSSSSRHERTHTNEKPFKCSNCGKTFTLATTLQNHMKVHTNERSFRCEPCGKSFKLSHHLKTHQNTSLHRSVIQTGEQEN